MCRNATQTAYSVGLAIEPTLKALLSYENVLNTPEGQAAVAAYDSLLATLQSWKSGTPAQLALEAISAFQTAFSAVVGPLNLPPEVAVLVNIILGGVETIIGIVTANSPAPVSAIKDQTADASPEEARVLYQSHVIAETTAKVKALVPTFHRSFFHSAASQYKSEWNKAVDAGGLPHSLKA